MLMRAPPPRVAFAAISFRFFAPDFCRDFADDISFAFFRCRADAAAAIDGQFAIATPPSAASWLFFAAFFRPGDCHILLPADARSPVSAELLPPPRRLSQVTSRFDMLFSRQLLLVASIFFHIVDASFR
jgi:hypothetical protein